MNIVYISNFISPHVKPFCDTLYHFLNKDFKFIQTMLLTKERRNLGYELYNDKYIFDLTNKIQELKKIANDADCVIFTLGSVPYEIIYERIKNNKLTFFLSERLFKRGFLKIFDIKIWKQIKINILSRKKNVYLLCNGSFVRQDFELVGFHKNHSYKFGYFPKFSYRNKRKIYNENLKILWIGRMIDWKRPDLAIKICQYVSNECPVKLSFIGDGPLLNKLKGMAFNIQNENLTIEFEGVVQNSLIRDKFIDADALLITSNRREGWGAVVNEALSEGVPVVADNLIGSAKYLIDEGINGYSFEDGNIEDAASKLINIYLLRSKINFFNNCIEKIQLWNGSVAAVRFICIANNIYYHNKKQIFFHNGPLSKA